MQTQTTQPALSWYEVPESIKQLLLSAAENWEDTARSEQYMHQALAQTGITLDVLVAAYRYFFYKCNNQMALQMAQQVIDRVTEIEQLPDRWEDLKPILLARKEEANIRLFLNAYAASGFVWARLGELEKAKEITTNVSEIDDRKEFGGAAVVLDVLTRSPDEDDE